MPGTETAATPQAPQFDPLAEARTRWPGLAEHDDATLQTKLSDPNNFRSAFPEYGHVDDQTIRRNMSTYWQNRPNAGEQAIKDAAPKPYYGFTPGHMASEAWKGAKELGSAAYGAASDLVKTHGMPSLSDASALAKKYIFDPADEQAREAQTAKTPLESIGHSVAEAIPLVGPWAASLGKQAGTDPGGALARGGTQVAIGAAAPKIIKAAKPGFEVARESASEAIARPTLARSFSKKYAEDMYGHSPERAVVKENVSTSAQAEAKMKEVGGALSDQLNQHPNATVDIDAIVNKHANNFIKDAQRAGNSGVVARIEEVADAMVNEYGNLQKSPRAASEMKSKLYGDTKYRGQDEVNATADNFRKAVARDIRNEIDAQTGDPKVKEFNQRYGDLASARDAMKAKEIARGDKGILESAKNVVAERGARKTAQIIGQQYPPIGPGMTRQGPTPATGGPLPPGPGITRAALPAPGLPPVPGAQPMPAVPMAQLPAAPPATLPGAAERALPSTPFAPGGEPGLQSEAGPSAKPVVTPTPGTRIPPTGPPIEAPASTLPPEAAKVKGKAAPAAEAPKTANQMKADLAQLTARERTLNDQLSRSRSWPRSHEIIKKLRTISEQKKSLSGQIDEIEPRPAAKPFSLSPETRTGQVVPMERRVSERESKITGGKNATPADMQVTLEEDIRQLEEKVRNAKPGAERDQAEARLNQNKEMLQEMRATKPEAKPLSKESKTPTFDKLPKEDQEWITRYAKDIDSYPQLMRESELRDLNKHAGVFKGGSRKELIARRLLAERKTSAGAERQPGED